MKKALSVLIAGLLATTSQAAENSSPVELDLFLLGTVVLDELREPLAIIQLGKAGEQHIYRLGDTLEGGQVTKILRKSVTLTFVESEVELFLEGDPSHTPIAEADVLGGVQPPLGRNDEGYWRLEPETLDQLSRTEEFATQVTPIGTRGVRLDKVHPNDLLSKLGLREGDIILRINGRVPGSEVPLSKAFGPALTGGQANLQLEIERQGTMDLLYYQLEPETNTL